MLTQNNSITEVPPRDKLPVLQDAPVPSGAMCHHSQSVAAADEPTPSVRGEQDVSRAPADSQPAASAAPILKHVNNVKISQPQSSRKNQTPAGRKTGGPATGKKPKGKGKDPRNVQSLTFTSPTVPTTASARGKKGKGKSKTDFRKRPSNPQHVAPDLANDKNQNLTNSESSPACLEPLPESVPEEVVQTTTKSGKKNPSGKGGSDRGRSKAVVASLQAELQQAMGENDAFRELLRDEETEVRDPTRPQRMVVRLDTSSASLMRSHMLVPSSAKVLTIGRLLLASQQFRQSVVGKTLQFATAAAATLLAAARSALMPLSRFKWPVFEQAYHAIAAGATSTSLSPTVLGAIAIITAAVCVFSFHPWFTVEETPYTTIEFSQTPVEPAEDYRVIDQNMGEVEYPASYGLHTVSRGYYCTFRSGPLLRWLTPGFTMRAPAVSIGDFRFDSQKFFHLIGPRNGLSKTDDIIRERVRVAARTQTVHGTDRYAIGGGEERVLFHVAVEWCINQSRACCTALNTGLMSVFSRFVGTAVGLAARLHIPIPPGYIRNVEVCLVGPCIEESVHHLFDLAAQSRGLGVFYLLSARVGHAMLEWGGMSVMSKSAHVLKHMFLGMLPWQAALAAHIGHNVLIQLLTPPPLDFVGIAEATVPNYLWGYDHRHVVLTKTDKVDFPIRIRRPAVQKVQRPVSVRIGPVPRFTMPRPRLNDLRTAAQAIHQRLAIKPPVVSKRVLAELAETSRWLARTLLTPLSPSEDGDFDEWLNHTHYSVARKAQIAEAWEKTVDGADWTSECELVDMHIKDEPYPSYKPARAINSRKDAAKALEGKFFHLVEHEVFALVYFIKTIPLAERASFMKEYFGETWHATMILLETDFSKMESHFTPEIMAAIEMPLYEYMVSHNPRLQEQLVVIGKMLLGKNKITWRRMLTVIVSARRMSGEMNTSLGNGWANIVVMHTAFHRSQLTPERRLLTAVFEGDDGLIRVSTSDYIRVPTEADFLYLGFRITLEHRSNIYVSSFCGTIQSEFSDHVLYDPMRFLSNVGWSKATHVDFGVRKRSALLRVKCLSFASMFPSCPIIWAYTKRVIDLTVEQHELALRLLDNAHVISTFDRLRFGMYDDVDKETRVHEPSMDERLLVEDQFGMSIEDQLFVEEQCHTMGLNQFLEVPTNVPWEFTHYYDLYSTIDRFPPESDDGSLSFPLAATTNSSSAAGSVMYLGGSILRTHHRTHPAAGPAAAGDFNSNNVQESITIISMSNGKTKTNQKQQQQQQTVVRRRLQQKASQLTTLVRAAHAARTDNVARRKPARSGTGRDGELARLGDQPSKRVGTNRSRNGPDATSTALTSRKVEYRISDRNATPGGPKRTHLPAFAATRHPTMKAYRAAVRESSKNSPSLASGNTYHGATFDEHEFMEGSERHVIMTGREFLGAPAMPIGVASTTILMGARLPGAVFPISPKGLGGRAQLMASQFEQHKVKKLAIVYAPSVPATTPGSVAMYYRNDISTETTYLGLDEIRHAATYPDFIEFPVWQECRLDIKPSDALNRYFDDSTGDFKLSVQGLITCLAGSAFDLASPIGSFFLEYEIEFFAEALSYEVDDFIDAEMFLTATAVTATVTQADAVLFRNVEAVSYPGWSMSAYPPEYSAGDWAALEGWLFYGTVVDNTATSIPQVWVAHWDTPANEQQHFQVGQCIWFRFAGAHLGGGAITGQAEPYASLSEATSGPSGHAGDARGDGLIWSATGAHAVPVGNQGTVTISGRWLRLED